MMPYVKLKFKVLLIVFLIAKTAGTLFLLTGTFDNIGIIFGQQTAIAQDENEDSNVKNDEDDDKKKPKTKKSSEKLRVTLDGLEEKRIRVKEEEQRLKEDKAQLEEMKQDIEDRIDELAKLHKKIEVALANMEQKLTEEELREQQEAEAKLKQLVRVYSGMKPKQAGAIVNELDIEIAKKLFLRMKGDAAGKILSNVESSRAAKISEHLAANGKKNKEAQ